MKIDIESTPRRNRHNKPVLLTKELRRGVILEGQEYTLSITPTHVEIRKKRFRSGQRIAWMGLKNGTVTGSDRPEWIEQDAQVLETAIQDLQNMPPDRSFHAVLRSINGVAQRMRNYRIPERAGR